MERKTYISSGLVNLSEPLKSDLPAFYEAWKDPDTERGFNHKCTDTFGEFCAWSEKPRLFALIVRKEDNAAIGFLMLSPEEPNRILLSSCLNPTETGATGPPPFHSALNTASTYLHATGSMRAVTPTITRAEECLKKCGFQPNPDGNIKEKHYITGEDIIQSDYMIER
jgi:hypothetical protein